MTTDKPRTIAVPGDGADMLADAIRRVAQPSRRAFLQRTLTLGGLSLLTGCTPDSEASIERALTSISRFNDRAQAVLFDPARLALTSSKDA